jgi:hypothetical protein
MKKTVDIFIKSYKNDFWLLQLALKSISINVTGYNNLILLIPEKDKHDFDTRQLPERTLIHYIEEYGKGWLFQQVCKIKAHEYSNADYIMFSDSDCFFTYPIDLQTFIKDDKPEILYTEWSKVGDGMVWREPTEKFMKESVPYEMMRRNCLIYHRSTLVNISKYEPDIEKIIMSSVRFSEFNAMSAYAYKYEKDKYNFINTDEWIYTDPKSVQVWSHASKKEGVSEVHLREYIRTLETIIKSLGVNIPE